jgi:hypothetical protein
MRHTFMPHIKYIEERFRRLGPKIDSDEQGEQALTALATLMLHASDVPLEMRPFLKWRPSPLITREMLDKMPPHERQRAMKMGEVYNPYIQDITFLPSIENIIRRLQYPTFLYLHGIYVFMEHMVATKLGSDLFAVLEVDDLVLAGHNLQSIRQMTENRFYPGDSGIKSILIIGGRIVEENISPLMPLACRTDSSNSQEILDRETGMLGLVGKRSWSLNSWKGGN